MEENTYCVYMHMLISDGRKYIGITCQEPKVRWNYGNGYRRNTYLWRAIQKYGWNNFKHEILFETLTKEQACAKEQALIKLFNTQDPTQGFNLTSGGEHFIHSEDSIKVMSKIKTKWADFDQKIIQLYLDENKTRKETAKILDIPESGVASRIRLLDLTKTKEQNRQNTSKTGTKYFVDETILSKLYLEENKTQKEIAKILNVPVKAIDYRVHKLGLKKTKGQIKQVTGRKKK